MQLSRMSWKTEIDIHRQTWKPASLFKRWSESRLFPVHCPAGSFPCLPPESSSCGLFFLKFIRWHSHFCPLFLSISVTDHFEFCWLSGSRQADTCQSRQHCKLLSPLRLRKGSRCPLCPFCGLRWINEGLSLTLSLPLYLSLSMFVADCDHEHRKCLFLDAVVLLSGCTDRLMDWLAPASAQVLKCSIARPYLFN